IEAVVFERYLFEGLAGRIHENVKADERALRGENFVVVMKKRTNDIAKNTFRAAAYRDVLEFDAVALSQRLSQGESAGLRITAEVTKTLGDCLLNALRRAQRVFVGRQINDAFQAKLALELVRRLSWLVRFKRLYVRWY